MNSEVICDEGELHELIKETLCVSNKLSGGGSDLKDERDEANGTGGNSESIHGFCGSGVKSNGVRVT